MRLPCVADSVERRAEELAAARIALDRDANGLPADLAVEAQLEPGEPLGVGADEAEHMGGERSVGIHAPRLLEVPHAGNLKRIHGGQLLRQRLPLEPDEGLRRHLLLDARELDTQGAGHLGDAPPLLAQLAGPDVDRRDVQREGEQLAVAVEDLAPMGHEGDLLAMLAGRLTCVVGPAQHRQISGAAEQREEREREEPGGRSNARAAAARRRHRISTT